ncbi:MAG: DUF4126 domain-containing protein [Cyanobacteria bacterium P01_H01_bin.153]
MDIEPISLVLALCLGLGLSAACGFRVFIPPFAMSLATMQGLIELSPEWQWLGSQTAVIALGMATLVEVLAYFIPWVSNALDSVELVAAPIAGMLVTASSLSMVGDINPVLLWTTAAIAGGGTAEVVEGATAVTRLATASATGGLANPLVGVLEMLMSAVLTILAITAPIFAVVIVAGLIIYCWRRLWRWQQRRQRAQNSWSD